MRLQVRIAFRRDEITACARSEILRLMLEKSGTKPFWLDWSHDVFEEIAALAPRVLGSAHLAHMKLTAAEHKKVKVFEPKAKKLIKVTEQEFALWDKQRTEFPRRESPDGYFVTFPTRLVLSKANLDVGEFACPESGEYCFVADITTFDMLSSSGLMGVVASEVVEGGAERLRVLQARKVIRAGRQNLSFEASVDADGYRRLDRPAILAVTSEEEFGDDDVVLLPESRDWSAGTLLVSARFVEIFGANGFSGIRFDPVLVVGDDLWETACEQWGLFMDLVKQSLAPTSLRVN